MKDFYNCQTNDLKTSADIWTRINVVPVEYGTFDQTFHLTMWLFRFITRITYKWGYFLWLNIDVLVWIGIWEKLRIYKVPTDPVR